MCLYGKYAITNAEKKMLGVIYDYSALSKVYFCALMTF